MVRRAALSGGGDSKSGVSDNEDRRLSHSGIFFSAIGFSDLVGVACCEFASQFKGGHASIPKKCAFIYRRLWGWGRSKSLEGW